MKVRRFKGQFLKASVTAVVALGFVSPAMALEFFEHDTNRLIGDPRRGGDEGYVNTIADPGGEYTSPDNIINGTPQVLGSQPGHFESVRLNGLGALGINIPQPHLLPASDSRSAYKHIFVDSLSPDGASHEAAYGARAGAVIQWQTLQDGASVALEPLGSVTSVVYNVTPVNTASAFLGINPAGVLSIVDLINDGGSPGSAMEAPGGTTGIAIADFVTWVRDPLNPAKLITGFGLTPWDVGTVTAQAMSGGLLEADGSLFGDDADDFDFDPRADGIDGDGDTLNDTELERAVKALVGRIDVFEDTVMSSSLFDQTDDVNNDEDALNYADGTVNPGFGTDELNDAVDGTLLLSGLLNNVIINNKWTADPVLNPDGSFVTETIMVGDEERTVFVAVTESIVRDLSVQINKVEYFGGLVVIKEGLSSFEGTASASWTDIPFTNTTGLDDFGGLPNVYDFLGDSGTSHSADLTFEISRLVPEPITAGLGLIGLSALGASVTRRRRA